ncbi:MAG: hypothetical protein ABIA66_04670, partial [Candidatus Omnitrophota bacterium]
NPDGEFKFEKNDFKDIDYIYKLLEKNRKSIFNSKKFLRYSKEYLKGNIENPRCYAGRLYLSIPPNGNLNPCHKYRDFNNKETRLNLKNCWGCMRPCWREIDFAFENPFNQLRLLKSVLLYYIEI